MPQKSKISVAKRLAICFLLTTAGFITYGFLIYAGWITSPTSMVPALHAIDSAAHKRDSTLRAHQAMQEKNWDHAIRSFHDSLREDPDDTPVLYNLALAYDSAKGRELAALYMYHMLIKRAPGDARETGMARSRIPELEEIAADSISKLVYDAQNLIPDLPESFPETGYGTDSPLAETYGFQAYATLRLASALVAAGNTEAAYEVMMAQERSEDEMNQGFLWITQMQANMGDHEKAWITLRQMVPDLPASDAEALLQREYDASGCPITDFGSAASLPFTEDFSPIIGLLSGRDKDASPATLASTDLKAFLQKVDEEPVTGAAVLMLDGAMNMARTLARIRDCAGTPQQESMPDNNLSGVQPVSQAQAEPEMTATTEEVTSHEEANAVDAYENIPTDFIALKHLAEKGDARAQLRLGAMYLGGIEIAQDENEAIRWYTKSAEQGNFDAQITLMMIYTNYSLPGTPGRDKEKDQVQLYLWQSLVVANPDCAKYLSVDSCRANKEALLRLGAGMSDANRAEAKRLVSDFPANKTE